MQTVLNPQRLTRVRRETALPPLNASAWKENMDERRGFAFFSGSVSEKVRAAVMLLFLLSTSLFYVQNFMKTIPVSQAVGTGALPRHHRIEPGVQKGPVFRKGHVVREEDIPVLLSVGKENLYVYEPLPGQVHENDAAVRIGNVAAGKKHRVFRDQGRPHQLSRRRARPAARGRSRPPPA